MLDGTTFKGVVGGRREGAHEQLGAALMNNMPLGRDDVPHGGLADSLANAVESAHLREIGAVIVESEGDCKPLPGEGCAEAVSDEERSAAVRASIVILEPEPRLVSAGPCLTRRF